jgi:hypothetical protein
MLSVIIMSVKLIYRMANVIKLSVIMLNVIMLSIEFN